MPSYVLGPFDLRFSRVNWFPHEQATVQQQVLPMAKRHGPTQSDDGRLPVRRPCQDRSRKQPAHSEGPGRRHWHLQVQSLSSSFRGGRSERHLEPQSGQRDGAHLTYWLNLETGGRGPTVSTRPVLFVRPLPPISGFVQLATPTMGVACTTMKAKSM